MSLKGTFISLTGLCRFYQDEIKTFKTFLRPQKVIKEYIEVNTK